MAAYNKKQVEAMADEYAMLQKLELAIDSPNASLSQIIAKYGTMQAIYKNKVALKELISAVDEIIEIIAEKGQVRGRVMSAKTMERYLAEGERRALKQSTLDRIAMMNEREAAARLDVYRLELSKETDILKKDIDIFIKRAELSGITKKQTLKDLTLAAEDKAGPIAGFEKRVKSLEKAVLRREAAAAEINEYKKSAKPGEKWQWITVSASPCPDCKIRAGVILSWEAWEAKGLPGAGRTICGSYCMCRLYPVTIADEMFPEVKQFSWDKKSGVLTTASEMRTFGAESNQPK